VLGGVVGVALRLVDRLLDELELGTTESALSVDPTVRSSVRHNAAQPNELTGRVAHALMLAEKLGAEDAAGSDQLRKTLRGLLIDLERRAPRREAV
jgi:hypothetical protein